MSLVAYAVGLCAQRALKGATWAGARVLFEPNAPFDIDAGPCLVVYCEAGRIDLAHGPLLGGAGLRLRVECYLGAFSGAGDQPALDNSKSAALSSALLARQIARALWAGEPGSWGDAFARFSGAPQTSETLFEVYEAAKTNVRVEMRGFVFNLPDCMAEPAFGAAPQGLWAQWLEKMREEGAELALLADLIAAAITGASLPDWRADCAALGLAASLGDPLRMSSAQADTPQETPAPQADLSITVAEVLE